MMGGRGMSKWARKCLGEARAQAERQAGVRGAQVRQRVVGWGWGEESGRGRAPPGSWILNPKTMKSTVLWVDLLHAEAAQE